MENKATIIIATHKKYQMPADKMYLPVHVGAEGKKDSDGKDLEIIFPLRTLRFAN